MTTPALVAFALAVAASSLGSALAGPMPTSVEIVPVVSETGDSGLPIGNIRVRFADGHSELWTKQGHCLLPKITKRGLVGWTRYEGCDQRGGLMNDSIRLMISPTRWVDFRSGCPYIDDWDTSADGST